jgi:hypothetical protein
MLSEYLKNLAVIDVARRYDFVKSTLDAFSIELAFHDNTQRREWENDVHRDAGEFFTRDYGMAIVLREYLSEVGEVFNKIFTPSVSVPFQSAY